jgi:hypothetical protein
MKKQPQAAQRKLQNKFYVFILFQNFSAAAVIIIIAPIDAGINL